RSPGLESLTKSFARFLYCSRLGRGGRGSASDIRISFHGMPGVRTNQAERRFVAIRLFERWARPFPRTGCALRARSILRSVTALENPHFEVKLCSRCHLAFLTPAI